MAENSDLSKRKYYLDWLRVIAFYILILYHVGMIFVPWDFHIKNNVTLEWFETWMAFFSQWRLPLLFLISGMVIYYSLGKRSWRGVIQERSNRLLIPLLFGMLFIIPPQIYYERISNGVQYASYWEFWKTVLDLIPYPKGSFSWHHLWYIVYIFFYSILALPLFLYLKRGKSNSLKQKVNIHFKKYPNSIYFIIFPLLIFYYTLAPLFPITHDLVKDWYNHSISFSVFILGFCISAFPGLWDAVVLKRKQSLLISIFPALILILFVWGPTFDLFDEEANSFLYIYGVFKWIFIVSWLFTILGYSKFILDKPSKVLSYANESVYPLYILHQTIMIIFGYYIINLDWNIYLKFGTILIITFGGSFLFYELFIKRINLMRLLFGMKSKEIA